MKNICWKFPGPRPTQRYPFLNTCKLDNYSGDWVRWLLGRLTFLSLSALQRDHPRNYEKLYVPVTQIISGHYGPVWVTPTVWEALLVFNASIAFPQLNLNHRNWCLVVRRMLKSTRGRFTQLKYLYILYNWVTTYY